VAVNGLRTVERALRVVETISTLQPIGVTDLARQVGSDKNAVQRILVTLEAAGWIRPSPAPPTRWELTSKALVVGRTFGSDLRARARPSLEALQAATGETALLWVVSGDRVVVLDAVDSLDPLRVTVPTGFDTPLSAAPTFVAYFSAPFRRRIAATTDVPLTPAMVAEVRRRPWYALDGGYPHLCGIGAPVYGVDGEVTGSVMVVGPSSRLDDGTRQRVGSVVADVAARLSEPVGRPPDGASPTAGRPPDGASPTAVAAPPRRMS
jgi:IclR family transcriptional regulator, acetate operon repressor